MDYCCTPGDASPERTGVPSKVSIDAISRRVARCAALCLAASLAIGACSTTRPVRIGVTMAWDGVIGAQLAASYVLFEVTRGGLRLVGR